MSLRPAKYSSFSSYAVHYKVNWCAWRGQEATSCSNAKPIVSVLEHWRQLDCRQLCPSCKTPARRKQDLFRAFLLSWMRTTTSLSRAADVKTVNVEGCSFDSPDPAWKMGRGCQQISLLNIFKGTVCPKMKILSSSTLLHADGKSGEGL